MLALRDWGRDLGPFEPLDFEVPRAMAIGCPGGISLARDGDKYVASCAMPGVRRDDINLELHGNRVLTIRIESSSDKSSSTAQSDAPASAAHDRAAPDTADKADATQAKQRESAADASSRPHSFMRMERSVALPLLVDPTAITSTYADGLLRVDIPIQPPAMDDGPRARIAELEQEAKDADARIAELSKELTELKTKARDAHQAARREKAEAQRALQGSRHTLAITTGA